MVDCALCGRELIPREQNTKKKKTTEMNKKKGLAIEDLAEIIRKNPGCHVVVDNDHWALFDKEEDSETEIPNAVLLADSDDMDFMACDRGYCSGNSYGGDILQALARIQGITVESF
jgi:hypothetical protein